MCVQQVGDCQCLHVDEVALFARDGDTGTIPALGFNVLTDATNVDREV